MFFSFDWQVASIITYLEDFLSPVNLFSTTRLSRGFRFTTKRATDGRPFIRLFEIPFCSFLRVLFGRGAGEPFSLKKVPPHFLSNYANLYCSL